jgi:hypothetical protein
MGVFKKVGFDAIGYPVGHFMPVECLFNPGRNLWAFQTAVHEWIGLLAYWGIGRIDYAFPGRGHDHG